MRTALHHATATLPHLRRGLDGPSARKAAPHLRALTQAAALAITDGDTVLAVDGASGSSPVAAWLLELSRRVEDGRIHVEPKGPSRPVPELEGAAVVAPLVIQDRHIGALIALYERDRRLRPDDTRVVGEAAALVSAQVELSVVAAQEERLTKAELHALRARISPHFIYNSLAAIASYIHSTPDEARELADRVCRVHPVRVPAGSAPTSRWPRSCTTWRSTCGSSRRGSATGCTVRVQVDPDVLQTVVPVLSLQPLVENAVKHGVEARRGEADDRDRGHRPRRDVELR